MLSLMITGNDTFERKFSNSFAKYNNVKYCTPVMNGTSSLMAVLLALGVGYDDEVIVPGLTWVACATSVISLGARPIFADIDEEDFCISLDAVKVLITPKTRAIMIVHAFGGLADIDGFMELSNKTGIPVIEDCSQAHGAMWLNKRVGTFGVAGCFSMQHSKLLTSGEGGAIITNSDRLYSKLEQLRSDGRMFAENPRFGQLELVEIGDIQGHNMCLSEFQSSVLYDRLRYLDKENNLREKNASFLKEKLQKIDGVNIQSLRPQVSKSAYYNFLIQIDNDYFSGKSIDAISNAIGLELNTLARPVYQPITLSKLFNPFECSRLSKDVKEKLQNDIKNSDLSNAKKIRNTCFTLPHYVLLDDEQGMTDIVNALLKVQRMSERIPEIKELAAN